MGPRCHARRLSGLGPAALSGQLPEPVPRGRFITIEGGEGAGKTTQVGLLVTALERARIPARATREPGGSPGGEAIRRLLLDGDGDRWDAVGEALLLGAARSDHVARLVAPSFADSTLAYQGYGRGLALEDLTTLHRFALGSFTPDLTVILDLPAEVGLARVATRASVGDRFERLDRAFHERLRQGFRQIAAGSGGRCVLIDGSNDPQTVHRAVLDAVEGRLRVML